MNVKNVHLFKYRLMPYEAMAQIFERRSDSYRSPRPFHIKTLTFITVHLTDLEDEMELWRLYVEDLDQWVLSYRALPSKLCNPVFFLTQSSSWNNFLYIQHLQQPPIFNSNETIRFEHRISLFSVCCKLMKFSLHLCLIITWYYYHQKATKQANE